MLNSFINKEVGVITKKKIIPNIIGETKFPNKIPNLNQVLFKNVKKDEFINPKIKKIIEIIKDQILISLSFINGKNEIIKKTIEKTIPKFLLDPIFISFFFKGLNQ